MFGLGEIKNCADTPTSSCANSARNDVTNRHELGWSRTAHATSLFRPGRNLFFSFFFLNILPFFFFIFAMTASWKEEEEGNQNTLPDRTVDVKSINVCSTIPTKKRCASLFLVESTVTNKATNKLGRRRTNEFQSVESFYRDSFSWNFFFLSLSFHLSRRLPTAGSLFLQGDGQKKKLRSSSSSSNRRRRFLWLLAGCWLDGARPDEE